jgi:hypothetical protein
LKVCVTNDLAMGQPAAGTRRAKGWRLLGRSRTPSAPASKDAVV